MLKGPWRWAYREDRRWTGQEGSIRSKRDTDVRGFGQASLIIDSG